MRTAVRVGSALAAVGTVHAVVNTHFLRRPDPSIPPTTARVSVLVPARDEIANIARCLRALGPQAVAEILVLDDGSSDGTGAASRACGDPRVRVLDGTCLPPGWLGKPHACAQLSAAADKSSDVLVFLDADVRLAPAAIDKAVALLEQTGLDLISPHPRQVTISVSERLVQPLLQWSILTFLPLRLAERSPRPSLSAANGQFLVVRRASYDRAGGHAAVAGAVLDDLGLVRAMKATGSRGGIVDGSDLASCRMYDGWPALRDGYGKSVWAAFGSEPGAAAVLALLALAYVLPAVAAVCGSRTGALGFAAGVAGRVVTARATGGRIAPDALGQPLSVSLFGYVTVRSLVQRRRGLLRWKGRAF